MKRLRASSLVLVVVVMAGIIIVVFGASRLTLVQYNQSNRDEDNIYALSAARAGIEDGLLRDRYNRNAETGEGKVFRFNLTRGRSPGNSAGEVAESQIIAQSTDYNPSDQYYDMKLSFRGGQIGSFATNNTSNNPEVTKDGTLELTGFPTWTGKYYLRYRFEFIPDAGNDCRDALVQIQQIQQPIAYGQVTVKKPAVGFVVDSKELGPNIFIRTTPGSGNNGTLASSIRLRPYGCAVKYALVTSKTENGDGLNNDAGPMFDSTRSTITSTGYYGAAKRTLIAEIDRLSGQLISIYDFNLYSGTGDIKP